LLHLTQLVCCAFDRFRDLLSYLQRRRFKVADMRDRTGKKGKLKQKVLSPCEIYSSTKNPVSSQRGAFSLTVCTSFLSKVFEHELLHAIVGVLNLGPVAADKGMFSLVDRYQDIGNAMLLELIGHL
jgi:hypothetical protein